MFFANCTPRCPRPPMPRIATVSPGFAPELRSALNVDTPAHNRGAASKLFRASGMDAHADSEKMAYSAHPPFRVKPGTFKFKQLMKSPIRHGSQCPQCSPCQPTATLSPILSLTAPGPLDSTLPAIS